MGVEGTILLDLYPVSLAACGGAVMTFEELLDQAIALCQAADKAVQAYDAYVFSCVGRPGAFDALAADLLAEDAAIKSAKAARAAAKVGSCGKYDAARAAEFRAIAA